jgi:sigma-B regulation protein RsbU (phosphoserine phosphatase)
MTTADDDYFIALLADDPQLLYEQAPCGYLTTDGDGTIAKVNATFLAMTGLNRDDVLGRRFADLLTVGGRIYHETHYAPMLHMAGTAREIALDIRHADGAAVPVLVNAVADRGFDGRVEIIRVAVFDATHRRLYERELLRAKQRAEASEARAQALARTLQQTLIPPAPPQIPGLDVAAAYRPAGDGTEVGGDFYDVFQVGGGDWVVIVGDVCGKGAPAAVITALARYTLRAAAMNTPGPAAALRRLNEVMLQSATDRFCTVVMMRLRRDDAGWTAVIASAGHPLPLWRRADGTVECAGAQGVLVGVLPEPKICDSTVHLASGEMLVAYTDGLPEARRGNEFLGDDRIRRIVGEQGTSGEAVVNALLSDAVGFQGGHTRDDIVLVALRAG